MIRAFLLLAVLLAPVAFAQTPPARPTATNEPKIVVPDKDARDAIDAKRKALASALEIVTESPYYADAAVYLKAADWVVRHGEWYGAKAGEQTLAVLDAGLKRAAELKKYADAVPSWLAVRGKPVIRGYVSRVDESIQPYALTVPEGYDPTRKDNRLDVVLSGRDATKTEVKFLYARETTKPGKATDRLVVEPYGRGNNAYRWAGETDVFDSFDALREDVDGGDEDMKPLFPFAANRVVLRGFSMGGAGTWHLGLHHPFAFAAISPGAGFTVTKGYAKGVPNPLPDYVEKCLRIYDAADYAENAFNVPVVAYSGENDPQIAAARNVEARLKDHPFVKPFTHLVAPGLEHKQPAEWLAKIDEELLKSVPRKATTAIRFVTYTPRYGGADRARIYALETTYEKAEFYGRLRPDNPTVTTKNVRLLGLKPASKNTTRLTVDGQSFDWPKPAGGELEPVLLRRENGGWRIVDEDALKASFAKQPIKRSGLQGPIDDAFASRFTVLGPGGVPTHKEMALYSAASMKRFAHEWDKWMRGALPTGEGETGRHLVLFGDPGCNGKLAEILPNLPIAWTEKELIVNGVGYDPKTHVPVLIYPNPLDPEHYVVLNSGHTFHEPDFKGTNALLYPRLGDWAVLKPTPTKEDPAAAEVVAAGLFDENWQFVKK